MLQDIENIVNKLKLETNNMNDIIYRKKYINNKLLYIIYNEPLTSSDKISNFIIRSLNNITDTNQIKNNISNFKWTEIKNYDELCSFLQSGFTIILIEGENTQLALETKIGPNRGITTTDSEFTYRGSKDAFIEDYQTNIGLIKKRIKTNDLWINNYQIGKLTKTNIGILYLNNKADKKSINHIINKISKIKVDFLLNCDYLKSLIEDENKSILPTILTTERPDLVSKYLLEGRIAIIVDNSPYALIIPAFFNDFFKTAEDDYGKSINVSLTRIIKYFAFFISVITPAFYISITTYNTEMIPTNLLISFATQRSNVPFPAIIEAAIMLLSFEILREGDLRIPSAAGSSLSIVGALILGDAAVKAGIVSPIMIIVVAITSISSLLFSEPDFINGIRWYRILFMIGAAFLGIIGIVITFLLIITNMISNSSIGNPYLIPFVPFNKAEIKNSIIKFPLKKLFKRGVK